MNGIQEVDEIDDSYFNKLLFEMEVHIDDIDKTKEYLKNIFYYFSDISTSVNKNIIHCIFEAKNAEEAKNIICNCGYKSIKNDRYSNLDSNTFIFLNEAHVTRKSYSGYPYFYVPNNISKYSPIIEMINEETSLDNINLKFVKQDYINGAIDICKYSIDFYNDREKCKLAIYYFNDARSLNKMNIEEHLELFEKYKNSQIEYFIKFLNKFDK